MPVAAYGDFILEIPLLRRDNGIKDTTFCPKLATPHSNYGVFILKDIHIEVNASLLNVIWF